MKQTDNYKKVYEVLNEQYSQIGGLDFYKYIFPNNEDAGEDNQDFSKPNAIYLYYDDDEKYKKLRRRIMLNDQWENDYKTYVENNPMTLCGGLSYRRRSNKLVNAHKIHALIFDLDGVGHNEVISLLYRIVQPPGTIRAMPTPTFIVSSGNGLHLYYVFEEPIDLFPNIKVQMKAMKYDMTYRMWDYKGTSQEENIQYSSINQGFRMVGSINSKYGNKIVAFQTGEKVTIDYLNGYLTDGRNQVDLERPFRPTQRTREEAKELFPEWYERVVVGKDPNPKKWNIKNGQALYEWWKRKSTKALAGHRYFFLMCMAIYACKCNVPKKQLKADMQEMFETLKKIPHENPLTQEDVDSALESYDKALYCFTIEDIEKLSNIRIDRAKRNGRPQKQHLEIARATRDIIHPDNSWMDKNGRKSKNEIVARWRRENPEGQPKECINETGLSKNTVYKWWKDSQIFL